MQAAKPNQRPLWRADSILAMAPVPTKVSSHMPTLTRPIHFRTLLRGLVLACALLGAGCSDQAAADGNAQAAVQEKVKRIQARFPAWIAAGGDPSRVAALGKELDDPIRAGRFDEAEKIADRILAILDGAKAESAVAGAALPDLAAPTQTPTDLATVGPEREVELGRLPATAQIVFSRRDRVYVMDADGGNETQITKDGDRHLEHVAISPDRRFMVFNYFARPAEGGESSRMVVFDLERGVERDLVPGFHMAGNGGVDWDSKGYVYFTGVDRLPFAKPASREEFIANYAAHDVWKVRYDGSGLTRLTATTDRGEADVSVSEDGSMIAYMDMFINPPHDFTEIWVRNSDGSNPRLVYKGGKARESSVHDPELSPDNSHVIFSKVNPDFHNFPNDPNANTAHDLISTAIDGSDEKRLTAPGPISVIPDWVGDKILYLQLTDQDSPPFLGIVVMDSDGGNARRIKADSNIAKWIPRHAQ